MKNSATATRRIILESLLEIENGSFSHLVMRSVLDKYSYLPPEERVFIKRVVTGCVERQITLDYIINQFSKTKTNKCKKVILSILRMGVYQIYYMDSVPDSAAVNESVKLCMDKGFYNLKGFVNAVLRNIARADRIKEYPDMETRYSVPSEVINIVRDSVLDEKELGVVLASTLEVPSLTVRVNTSKVTVVECKKILEGDGVSVSDAPYFDYALQLSGVKGIENLEAFNKGYIAVQDVASMFVGQTVNISEDVRVLDLCSSPGGKSFHIADRLMGKGEVISCDISDQKTDLIRDGALRQGFLNINVMTRDALSDKVDFDEESFDIIIADLPCSGLGVMGRKADIKYRISSEDIKSLAFLQKEILKNNIKYLKKGGYLLFSTCTITKEENIDNYRFIKDELGLSPVDFSDKLPAEFESSAKEGYLQLLPGVNECDGFFISQYIRL